MNYYHKKASQKVTENIIFTWRKTEINRIANMEFITTTRGGRQLLRDSYLYYKNKSLNNGSLYWECKERRSGNGCKVKIVLDEQETSVISLVSTSMHQTLRQ